MLADLYPRRSRRRQRRKLRKRRARESQLVWPRRPRLQKATVIGDRRMRWISLCGRYRIDRYPDRSGRYLAFAFDRELPLSNHRDLTAAKRACQSHARKASSREADHAE